MYKQLIRTQIKTRIMIMMWLTHLSIRMASVRRSFSSHVSLSSAMIFSVSCRQNKDRHLSVEQTQTETFITSRVLRVRVIKFLILPSYLEPLNGLLTGRAEDAVVEVVNRPGSAGHRRQRGRGTHPCHCIGHCGEITPLIDSLAIVHKVFVIAQVCQRERHGSEEDRRTDGREVGADAG